MLLVLYRSHHQNIYNYQCMYLASNLKEVTIESLLITRKQCFYDHHDHILVVYFDLSRYVAMGSTLN